jgi:hypothetical protein
MKLPVPAIAFKVWFLGWLTVVGGMMAAFVVGRVLPQGSLLTFTAFDGEAYQLYVLDVNRRLLTRLPDGERPYQNFYGWSADGRFAFLSDRDGNTEVYLWEDGEATNISQHPFNDWRPSLGLDGRVAFASERDGNMEIYVWDEGTLTNVSQAERTDDYPVWSDDGRLAWVSDRMGNSDIFVWDGVNTVNVSQSPETTDYAPTWGAGMLTWMASGLFGAEVLVWDGEQVGDSLTFVGELGWTWSNDGRLAYTDTSDIYIWDGVEIFAVTQSPMDNDFSPTWLSDGRLAFLSLGLGGTEIYVWDGNTTQRLTYNQLSENGLAASR